MSEFYFDNDAANEAVRFFKDYLVHVDGEWSGQPFDLAGWEGDEVIRPLYGWKRNTDGLRRYRRAWIEVPIGQGKTTLAAGVALKSLAADREPGAQVFLAAMDAKQATNVFRPCAQMVYRNPKLSEYCEVHEGVKRILLRATGSYLQVLPGEAPRVEGINASCVIFDEIKTQKDRRLYEVLSHRTRSRRQPLFVMLTTAGYDENSLWGTLHKEAMQLRDNPDRDPTSLVVFYGADPTDDWKSEDTWRKACPSYEILGATFQEGMRLAAKRAEDFPIELNAFKRDYLNIPSRYEARFIPMNEWDASFGQLVIAEKLKNRTAYGGLDIGPIDDLSAFVLVFPPEDGDPDDTGVYEVLSWFWASEASILLKARLRRIPYDTWVMDGFIKTNDGEAVSFGQMKKDILLACQQFNVHSIEYDPKEALQITQDLSNEGITCVQVQQGFRLLSSPTNEVARLIKARRLYGGGNPVMRFCADNVVVHQDHDGAIRPDKMRSPEKIDGFVALVMALDGAMRNRAEPSVYAERGLISI